MADTLIASLSFGLPAAATLDRALRHGSHGPGARPRASVRGAAATPPGVVVLPSTLGSVTHDWVIPYRVQ
jgi:hypothetical protein